MKKLSLFLFTLLIVFSACSLDEHDDTNTFKHVDYSKLITEDYYMISPQTTALEVFNLFYDEYGYGEFDIIGTAEHNESAILIGKEHSETISCEIKKIKIYRIDESISGMTVVNFYVDFYNENNEILSYRTKWQYKNTNVYNEKNSNWFQNTSWYKTANEKEKNTWNIIVNR